jgi:hypothetical protein
MTHFPSFSECVRTANGTLGNEVLRRGDDYMSYCTVLRYFLYATVRSEHETREPHHLPGVRRKSHRVSYRQDCRSIPCHQIVVRFEVLASW